ncbi:hypothetical protein JOD27_005929 [Lentzea nigeriaca]|nr:hypothetical protein [Lentzea nigeriaca]
MLDRIYGTKRLRHEVAGDLDLSLETLALPGDQALVVYSAPAGSPAGERPRLPASWVASPAGSNSPLEG